MRRVDSLEKTLMLHKSAGTGVGDEAGQSPTPWAEGLAWKARLDGDTWAGWVCVLGVGVRRAEQGSGHSSDSGVPATTKCVVLLNTGHTPRLTPPSSLAVSIYQQPATKTKADLLI